MIEIMQVSISSGDKPRAWRMREKEFSVLKRQSRHTGDVANANGQSTFLHVPIEIGDVRNSLGAELAY